ncbi:DMT family transporter [Fibrella forsythiae]|uniref:DMT family transporter n=1 Tax=Fibrella forsythiae TaxID=2817061 RepID=A0ABS3JM98_9BACT|nr:DMT family transporter [Fibrella forsythiae]MBO0950324.1 DMT family transporter [Fibrella forsythiae]
MPNPSFRDYLHLHFIVLIWGFTAILGLLLEPLGAPALVALRTGLAALGLVVVLRVKPGLALKGNVPEQRQANDQWALLATGGIIAVHWFAFFWAARLANASVCLAGMATSSLWASALEPIILKRRVKAVEVLMGVVVMSGLYLIFRFEFDKVAGLSMAVFSAMLAALFTIINSRFAQRHASLVIARQEMIGAFLTSAVLCGIYIAVAHPPLSELLPQRSGQWLWLFILAFVCTVYAYTAGVSLLRKFSPYMAILTVNLEPVYGILLAVLIFNDRERMTTGFYLGTLVILLAVLAYPFLNRVKSEE